MKRRDFCISISYALKGGKLMLKCTQTLALFADQYKPFFLYACYLSKKTTSWDENRLL